MARVAIEPYSERWRADFARLGGRLRALLGDRAVRIDHIGSTAVPGARRAAAEGWPAATGWKPGPSDA